MLPGAEPAEPRQEALDLVPRRSLSETKRLSERARAALIKPRTIGILIGIVSTSVVVQSTLAALSGGDSPATTAARLASSMCALLMDTSLWLSMDKTVLKMLTPRARYVHA